MQIMRPPASALKERAYEAKKFDRVNNIPTFSTESAISGRLFPRFPQIYLPASTLTVRVRWG